MGLESFWDFRGFRGDNWKDRGWWLECGEMILIFLGEEMLVFGGGLVVFCLRFCFEGS